MRNATSHSNLKRTRLFTFFICFLILAFLAVSYSIILLNIRNVTSKTKRLQDLQTEQIASHLNEIFNENYRMCETLASNTLLRTFSSYTEDSIENRPTACAYDLRKEMMSLVNTYEGNTNTLAVYFPRSRNVITMARWLESDKVDLFFNSYADLSPEQLEQFSYTDNWSIHLGNDDDPHSWIIYRIHDGNDVSAYIISEFSLERYVRSIADSDIQVIVTGPSGSSYTSPAGLASEDLAVLSESAQKNNRYQYRDTTYTACCLEPRFNGCLIIAAISLNSVDTINTNFIYVTIASSALIILCIMVLISYLRKKFFSPVSYMLNTVAETDSDPSTILPVIADNYVAAKSENQKIKQEKSHLLPLALGRQLNRLLEITDSDLAMQLAGSCLTLAGLKPESSYVMFALFCAEDRKHFFSSINKPEGIHTDDEVLRYLLTKMFSDHLFADYPGLIAPFHDNWFVILLQCESFEDSMQMQENLLDILDLFENSFDARLIHTDLIWNENSESFIQSLMQTSKEMSYQDFWGNSPDTNTLNLLNSDPEDLSQYSQRIRRLINQMNTKDYRKIPELVLQITDEAIPSGIDDMHLTKYRMYTLIALIVTALDEHLRENPSLAKKLNFEERLYHADNIKTFREELHSIFTELAEYNSTLETPSASESRIHAIKEYIKHHYSENTLNVSSIASAFGISPSYLSREFKENTGMNILEYIQRQRVNAAKQHLATESIKITAEKVGFGDAQALVRAFKKYEGISPSDYRKTQN